MYSISVKDREIATLYICPYNKKNSEKTPNGFKFFKENDQSDIVHKLSNQAVIDAVYENGIIEGFVIVLNVDYNTLLSLFKNTENKSIFIEIIEERIKNKHFINDREKILEAFMDKPDKVAIATNATKAVLTSNYEPIFGW
jgi:hypothetical protein